MISKSELRAKVIATGSHHFDAKTMKFFGDTMANYGIRETTITTWSGPEPVEVYELYRRQPVKHGLRSSAYFDKKTFERRHGPVSELPKPACLEIFK
jgi:hypothetical protein